jgi:hypothetical protein
MRVPSLQPTSSTQPTEGRASAEGETTLSGAGLAEPTTDGAEGQGTIVGRTAGSNPATGVFPNIDTQRLKEALVFIRSQADPWSNTGDNRSLRDAMKLFVKVIDKAMALPSPEPVDSDSPESA